MYRWMTLKVIQGHQKWRDSIGHLSLPISGLWYNNVSIVQRLRDINTFSSYMTARDFENSFSFDTTVEITGRVRFPIHV